MHSCGCEELCDCSPEARKRVILPGVDPYAVLPWLRNFAMTPTLAKDTVATCGCPPGGAEKPRGDSGLGGSTSGVDSAMPWLSPEKKGVRGAREPRLTGRMRAGVEAVKSANAAGAVQEAQRLCRGLAEEIAGRALTPGRSILDRAIVRGILGSRTPQAASSPASVSRFPQANSSEADLEPRAAEDGFRDPIELSDHDGGVPSASRRLSCGWLRAMAYSPAHPRDALTWDHPVADANRRALPILCDYLKGMWRALTTSGGDDDEGAFPYATNGSGSRHLVTGWPTTQPSPELLAILIGPFSPFPFPYLLFMGAYVNQAVWQRGRGASIWIGGPVQFDFDDPDTGRQLVLGFRTAVEIDTIGLAIRMLRSSLRRLRRWESDAASLGTWSGMHGFRADPKPGTDVSSSVLQTAEDAILRVLDFPMVVIGAPSSVYERPTTIGSAFVGSSVISMNRDSLEFREAVNAVTALRTAATAEWALVTARRGGAFGFTPIGGAGSGNSTITRDLLLNAAEGLARIAGVLYHEALHLIVGQFYDLSQADLEDWRSPCCGPNVVSTSGDGIALNSYRFTDGNDPMEALDDASRPTLSRQIHHAIYQSEHWLLDLLTQETTSVSSGLYGGACFTAWTDSGYDDVGEYYSVACQ